MPRSPPSTSSAWSRADGRPVPLRLLRRRFQSPVLHRPGEQGRARPLNRPTAWARGEFRALPSVPRWGASGPGRQGCDPTAQSASLLTAARALARAGAGPSPSPRSRDLVSAQATLNGSVVWGPGGRGTCEIHPPGCRKTSVPWPARSVPAWQMACACQLLHCPACACHVPLNFSTLVRNKFCAAHRGMCGCAPPIGTHAAGCELC